MSLLDELHPAAFKGASFFIVTANKTAGRKIVIYDYPGKDITNSQDLGKLPASFTLNGTVTGTTQLDYFTAKKRLETALESPGAGLLLHPFYGPINCVALPYTVVDDTGTLNEAQYTLPFRKVGKEIFPTSTSTDTSEIIALNDEIVDNVYSDLSEKYAVNSPLNRQDGGLKLNNLTNTIRNILISLQLSTENKEIINRSLSDIDENAFIISSNSLQMADTITTLMQQLANLTDNSILSYDINSSLFGFGNDDTKINPSTTDLQERATNREIINNAVNILALSNMYMAASSIDYDNDEQIDAKIIELKNNYNFIINDNILSNNTLDIFYNLNASTRLLLENIEVNISKVILIFVKTTDLATLVYNYYGSLDRYDEILELNDNLVDPMIISGNIKILTN